MLQCLVQPYFCQPSFIDLIDVWFEYPHLEKQWLHNLIRILDTLKKKESSDSQLDTNLFKVAKRARLHLKECVMNLIRTMCPYDEAPADARLLEKFEKVAQHYHVVSSTTCWTPRTHFFFHEEVREKIFALFLVWRNPGSIFSTLPKDLFLAIASIAESGHDIPEFLLGMSDSEESSASFYSESSEENSCSSEEEIVLNPIDISMGDGAVPSENSNDVTVNTPVTEFEQVEIEEMEFEVEAPKVIDTRRVEILKLNRKLQRWLWLLRNNTTNILFSSELYLVLPTVREWQD